MMQQWHTIDLGWEFVERILPAVCPINNYELIILGGSHVRKETQMSSVWLFDTRSETGQQVVGLDDCSLHFDSIYNQCTNLLNDNVVIARVRTINRDIKLIKYVKGADRVETIEEIEQ